MDGQVTAVSRSQTHTFSKQPETTIRLLTGLGIEGDAHMGKTVKHRSRVAKDPTQPNLRQVHLMHQELFDEVATVGYTVVAGDLGENITTRGIDLLGLPTGTKLRVGKTAVVEITGLRNPCRQIDAWQKGLLKEVVYKDTRGNLIRKAGIMGIVLASGEVSVGDAIQIELPPEPHKPLERV
ncbi:MAG: MOSC domain-containing protein [Chloroflexota bacterium]